jgi:rRNA processing protein Krr1/Pno1
MNFMSHSVKTMKGIGDLTSSEGDLIRFSNLCRIVGTKGLTRRRLREIAKVQLQLTNRKVLDRHVSILERLEVLKCAAGRIVLASEGKVLYEFVRHLNVSRNLLHQTEVVFYFKLLFKYATKQLAVMLQTISENEGKERENQIVAYFKRAMTEIPGLWNPESIQRNLWNFEEGKGISRFFENKYRCMEKWLVSMGLLAKSERGRVLTSVGRSCLRKIEDYNLDLANHLNELARLVARRTDEPYSKPSFSLGYQEKVARRRFLHACRKFRIAPELVDLQAARSWTASTVLVKDGIVLEDDVFDDLLDRWQNQGLIRSITVGKNGKRDIISV